MGQIKEHSFLHIVLKEWVPTLITVLVGGGLLTTLIPRCQTDFERTKAYESHRLSIAESTAKDFTAYILYWQRLRDVAELEKTRMLSPDEAERKKEFAVRRNESVNALYDDLAIARLYFSSDILKLAEDFMRWDRSYSNRRLDDLPSLENWYEWKEKMATAMTREIKVGE
jgi:hypothetical protein